MNFILILVFLLTSLNIVICEKTNNDTLTSGTQHHSYTYHYPQIDNIIRSIVLCVIAVGFAILLVLVFGIINKFDHMRIAYQIKKNILNLIPKSQRILYIINVPDPIEKNESLDVIEKLIRCMARDFAMMFESLFLISKSHPDEEIIFDIDDSKNIIKVIREASENNKDLLIYIDTPGGNLISSDEVCKALKIYQSVPKTYGSKHKKSGSRIICAIDRMAQSAGTMIALSADTIHMNKFAVLGPTDPQVIVTYEDCDYGVSCQLYNDLEKSLDKISECDPVSYIVMRDRQNSYRDNINMFKTLNQYKIANNMTKQKMIKAFCNNFVPHHRGFSTLDLSQMGIQTMPLSDHQKHILKLLEKFKDEYLQRF